MNTSTAAQTVTVTNVGTRKVSVNSASTSDPAFAVAAFPATTLSPGQSLTVQVTFTPTAVATYSATLVFNTSPTATSSPVTLSGAGTAGTSVAIVGISISPASAALQVNGTQQFTATVTGSSNTSATWSVNGVSGGNSTVGTISASGLYTAPAAVPSGGAVTVTATSAADTTKTSSATVTIAAAPTPVSVSITPTTASVQAGGSQQFSATVSGTTNTQVTWQVNGINGGNSTYGTISSTGLYYAPASVSSNTAETVTALSYYDSTKSANANVTVMPVASGANNYYVATNGNDANNGSSASPWRTITHAASMVSAGAVVHVAPGVYNEAVRTGASGTSSAHVKFISDQKWGAQINGGGAQFAWYVTGDYEDIEGFDITNASYVGVGYAANHLRILNNRIHDMVNISCGSNGGAAIDADSYSVTDAQVIGNFIYNIGPGGGTTRCDTIQGIYFATSGNYAGNNLITSISGDGISSWHYASNLTIVNNTVLRSLDAGIIIGGGSVTNSNCYVANNIIAYNPNAGIAENGSVSGNKYVNNLMYGNGYNFSLSSGTQSGTITANPMFVNYTGTASGDYHLQSSSPAINAGTSTNAPAKDFDGGARPAGGAYDIGAYEYGATAAAYPWY